MSYFTSTINSNILQYISSSASQVTNLQVSSYLNNLLTSLLVDLDISLLLKDQSIIVKHTLKQLHH